MGKRKLVIFDFDETFLLTLESHGGAADTFKNPHRLLPVVLFMKNSPLHKIGILTNRSPGNEMEGLSSLDANKQLESMGISFDERYIIRRPADYAGWLGKAHGDFIQNADKSTPDKKAAAEDAARKKFGGKNHRLEQMRQRALIEEGIETPIEDTIMVDDSEGVIHDAQLAGFDTVKATEYKKDDDNSQYLLELAQKIGLDDYLDDLISNSANHRNDPPMQVAGALMYGIQTRDNFEPKLSDYLKNMTISEKQQVKAMIQYINKNRPDYESTKDFKAFEKALPSDRAAKKNEQKRHEANRQFLQEAENKVNQLLNKYDQEMKYADIESMHNKDAAFKTNTREQIAVIRQKVSQLMKDNDPSIRIAAKAVSEKIAEHGAVTQSHLKQLTALNQQLSSGHALTEKQLHLLENTLSDSRNLEVRSNAKQLLEAHKVIKSLYAEFQNYKDGKLDQSEIKAFEFRINTVFKLPIHPSVRVAALAIDTEIKLRQLGPYQEPVKDLLNALASTSNQEVKPIVDQFFKNWDLTKMDSIKKCLQDAENSISLLLTSNPNNPAIKQLQQAITDFRGKIKAIEEPAVILPSQKTGPRQLPIAPGMVVAALNKQTQPGWEMRQVNDRGLQSSQIFSAKMTKAQAETLVTSLHNGLKARVIESASDKNDNRYRVALDTKDGVALLQRRAPLTVPPTSVHRPPPIAPMAASAKTSTSTSTSTAPSNAPVVKGDDPKRRSGPSH